MVYATAFDFETFRIGPGRNVAPPPICLAAASREPLVVAASTLHMEFDGIHAYLMGNDDDRRLRDFMRYLLKARDCIGAYTAYDLTVVAKQWPELCADIFEAGDDGRLHDVQLAQKLLRLSKTGNITGMALPDGTWLKLTYSLAVLERKWLATERKLLDDDDAAGDEWRTNYSTMDKINVHDYPAEAQLYALQDAINTLRIWEKQNDGIPEYGHGSMQTDVFQTMSEFCLRIGPTCRGLRVDRSRVPRVAKLVEEALSVERMQPLYDADLITPPQPSRPYKGQEDKPDPKMTRAKLEKENTKQIREFVEGVCKSSGVAPKRTKTGLISTDDDMMGLLEEHDDSGLITLYRDRGDYLKLRSTYLPALADNDEVWPNYDGLKNTGRTSSFGNRKTGKNLYPSFGVQQVPRQGGDLGVRECIVARDGFLLCSIDFGNQELCTFGQATYDLFGRSTHRDKLNAGYDLHAFLGAQIAAHLDNEFREVVEGAQLEDPDTIYKLFIACKSSDDVQLLKLYKHFRRFAKPVGLGYPGGLGPKTFCLYARKTYGVVVDLELATTLRNLHRRTYTEIVPYFAWVQTQKDPRNEGGLCYQSPLGMYRANTTFCQLANGFGMQTPAAEASKAALILTTRACIVEQEESILYGSWPVAFMHDEILFEFPAHNAHECALEAERLMLSAMSVITPDVKCTAAPALMARWHKDAEPVYRDGRLIPWVPDGEED